MSDPITVTPEVLEATLERMVQQRVDAILAAKAQQAMPEGTTTHVGHHSVFQVVPDSAQQRESVGYTLPEIVVDKTLTVPALVLLDETLDLVVPSKIRSPYNKARFRMEGTQEVLANDVTFRALYAEHARLIQVKATKPVKTQQVQAVLSPTVDAKVQHLMTTLGWDQAKAEAAVAALA